MALSKDSYVAGFDELNFDYIRFPSDGNMKDIDFSWSKGKTKADALEYFLLICTMPSKIQAPLSPRIFLE